MSVVRTPTKLAPVFTSAATQSAKRKMNDEHGLDPNNSSLIADSQIDPKRICTGNEVVSDEVTNVMILQAITSLTNRFDGLESKIMATVDTKLQALEKDIAVRVTDTEKQLETRMVHLESKVYESFNKLEDNLEGRMYDLESHRPSADQEARIDQLERISRANELIISGVPRLDNENIDAVCNSICEAIGFTGNNTIQTCFRVPLKSKVATSNKPNRPFSPSIIIKFWSTDAKISFFKSYMDKKSLCVTDIGFSTPARVYINENFTKKNFEIFRMARKLKVDGKIFQYHTSVGRVSVKLNADSRQIGIDSSEQLNSIIEDFAAQQNQQPQKHKTSNKPSQGHPRGQQNNQQAHRAHKSNHQQLHNQQGNRQHQSTAN